MNKRALVSLATKPERQEPCDICGDHCEGQWFSEVPQESSAKVAHMPVAPHRIVDTELQRVIYSPGQNMTREDAIKYGVPLDEERRNTTDAVTERMRKISSRARKPQQDRAVKPAEDRSPEPEPVELTDEDDEAQEDEPVEQPEVNQPRRRGRPRKTVEG